MSPRLSFILIAIMAVAARPAPAGPMAYDLDVIRAVQDASRMAQETFERRRVADNPARELAEVRAMVAAVGGPYGVSAADVDAAFSSPFVGVLSIDIISKFKFNDERKLTPEEYVQKRVTPELVQRGGAFYREHGELLERVAADKKMDAMILVGIAGIETWYGAIYNRQKKSGSLLPTFNVLTTIVAQYLPGEPGRAAAFARQLAAFIAFCRREKLDPYKVEGSYAGAVGYGQFMPTNLLRYAEDYDGVNGVELDAWPDVLASMSNLLEANGYKAGAAFGPLPSGCKRSAGNWRALCGYNPSVNYISAVKTLSDRIEAELQASGQRR